LIFEVRFAVTVGPRKVYQGSGMAPQEPQVRLVISDPKTQVVLWAFTEPIKQAALPANGKKNCKLTLAKVVNDVKELTGSRP
jgi:hypothetical protein